MDSVIRLLTIDDTSDFKKLRIESLLKDPDSWLATYEEEKDLPLISFSNKIQYARTPPVFGYYGYFDHGRLLAYAQLASSYWNKKKHVVNFYDVCVAPDARRKSVGTKLIKFIINSVKSVPYIEEVQLRVNSNNKGGCKFYENIGFKKMAVIKKAIKEDNGKYQDEYVYSYLLG